MYRNIALIINTLTLYFQILQNELLKSCFDLYNLVKANVLTLRVLNYISVPLLPTPPHNKRQVSLKANKFPKLSTQFFKPSTPS